MSINPKMHKVTLFPSGKTIEVVEGKALLTALKEQGIYIKSTCGGVASCGDCVVRCTTGEANLVAPTFAELKLLGNVFHITKERLSCQTTILGDVTIDIGHHDKDKDEAKTLSKTTTQKRPGVVIRKKGEIPKKQANPEESQTPRPQRVGGGSRAKKFNYTGDE